MHLINSTCLIALVFSVFCGLNYLCPAKIEAARLPIIDSPSPFQRPPLPVTEDEIVKFIKTAPAIGKALVEHHEVNRQNDQIKNLGWELSRFNFLSHYLPYLLYAEEVPVGQNDAYFQILLKQKSSTEADEKSIVNKYKPELSTALTEVYQSGPFTEKELLSYLEATKLITDYYKAFSELKKYQAAIRAHPKWRANQHIFEITKKNGLEMVRYQALTSRLRHALAQLKAKRNLSVIYDTFIPGPPLTPEELKLVKKYEQQIMETWKPLEDTLDRFAKIY